MDEAHNIEDDERGLRIELLLATVNPIAQQPTFYYLCPMLKMLLLYQNGYLLILVQEIH